MQPPARESPALRCGRALIRLAALLPLLPVLPGQAADTACRAPASVDPRLAELLAADPDDPAIDITSASGELSREGEASLKGDVRIRVGQRLLRADAAEVNATERSVALHGNVEYLDPQLHVRGTAGRLAADGNGEFEGAEFELPERMVRGSAKSASVREQRLLELEQVRYTACPRGNDDWLISAERLTLDQQTRNGTGRDVRLDFKGVPILYTPYISFPVGDQRKSGFLFPTIGSGSRTGTQVAVPWYWNIAPNYDATFTGRWFSSRGLRFDPEFRYLTAHSRGELNGEYVFDDLEEGGPRSYVDWRHVTHFQPRSRLLVDAADVSDPDYFEDFGVGFEGTSITYLNRLAELRFDGDYWSVSGRAQDYRVLDRELAPEDRPYSIAPQVAALGRWRNRALGLTTGVRGELTNFLRDEGVEGLRLDGEPFAEWRYDRRGAYVAGAAAWRYTSYALDGTAPGEDDAPDRSAPVLSLDTGLVLERAAGSRDQRRQTLEPRLLYLYVPYRKQDALPLFDTGLPDLNLVQLFRSNRYVGADRLGDANQLSAGVTTRLLDPATGRQFLSATLGQAYFFEQPRVRLPEEPDDSRSTSDLIAEAEVAAYRNFNVRVAWQWDPERTRTELSEAYLQYAPATNRVANLGYRFRRDSVEQVDASVAWPIGEQWRGFARWVYSLREEKTLDQFVGLEYGSCCWALRVVTRRFVSSRTGDSDTSIGLQLELKGLSSVGVDSETFLREAIRGYSALPPAR